MRRRCWCRTAWRSPTPRLPDEVRRLGVTTTQELAQPDDGRAYAVAGRHLRPALRLELCPARIRDGLLRLDGVGDIVIFGEREFAARVWLDPDQLSAFGLTAGDVVSAIREQNIQVSGGTLGGRAERAERRFRGDRTTQGRLEDRPRSSADHRQVHRRRPDRPRRGRRAGRDRRAELHHEFLPQRQAGCRARHLPAARHRMRWPDRTRSSPRWRS